jgi:hypothetical protein
MKKPAMMELGRRDGVDGNPGAWGEMEVDCGEHRSSEKHWCNIQLEIVFAKNVDNERTKIVVLGGDGQVQKTAYLLNPTNGDVRSRVYVIGVECADETGPTVRVAITGAENAVKGNARVTFLRAKCEKEDKTNWRVGSNWDLYRQNGLPFKRPTFLIGI